MSRWNTPKENDPYPFTPMRTTANFLFLSPIASQHSTFIADVWPHARTRGGRGCRPHGLDNTSSVSPTMSTVSILVCIELKHTGTLDVSDDGTGLVVHELDTDLGDTTTRACAGLNVSIFRSFIVRVP